MNTLLELLRDNFPSVNFEQETALIDEGILTSLDVVMLVGEISDAFDVEITADDILPENFNSAKAIYDLICRLQEA